MLLAYFATRVVVEITSIIAAVVYTMTDGQMATTQIAMETARIFNRNPFVLLVSEILLTAVTLLLFRRVYRRPIEQIGFTRVGWLQNLLYGCVFGIIAISALCLPLFLTGQATIVSLGFPIARIFPWILVNIAIGLMEETMLRGYSMTALKTTRNKYVIVLTSAAIFAAMHALNPGFTFLPFFNLFISGVTIALLFLKSGSLWVPIGFHITWNMFMGVVYGMPVSGVTEMPSIIKTELSGSSIITGGAFGPESSVLVSVIMILCAAFTLFIYKPKTPPAWTPESDMPLTRGVKHAND
jgi:membrane protease YdiL (CAAX protease family)